MRPVLARLLEIDAQGDKIASVVRIVSDGHFRLLLDGQIRHSDVHKEDSRVSFHRLCHDVARLAVHLREKEGVTRSRTNSNGERKMNFD